MTHWLQSTFTLAPRARGFHLVTDEVLAHLPDLGGLRVGMAHLFIQHTSAALAIMENADPEVRTDLEAHFRRLAPDDAPHYTHTYEGPDDMSAHIKAILIGPSLTIPITGGRLNLGTWQGIYLCEHRAHGGARRVVATVWGETHGEAIRDQRLEIGD